MRHRNPLAAVLVTLALAANAPAQKADQREAVVGARAYVSGLVLPGSALRARPITAQAPIVLRILAVRPHGELFRYDLEWTGLEPGRHDLVDFMEREDGSSTDDLPPVPVEVRALLPAGRLEPNALEPGPLPEVGGYQVLLVVGGILWGLGLVAILFVGRRRARTGERAVERPVTLADRLRPRVEAAVEGRLDDAGRAELERLLLAHWRSRLDLADAKVSDAIASMRRHPEAGELLRALEDWLHRPAQRADVDVAALLRPYRDVPAEPAP